MQKAYLMKKKAKNLTKLKNYFDDDSDDDKSAHCPPTSSLAQSDDYDPLDAFMQKNEEQIAIDSVVPAADLPEIVSEQDREYAEDVQTEVMKYTNVRYHVMIIT